MIVKIWSLIFLTFWCSCVVSSEKNVICYYGTWATYRWGNGKFDVENINPFLCTHLIYTFVGIDNLGRVISLDTYLDLPTGRDNFANFNRLKKKNPQLKTLLAVGGWNEGSEKYSNMAANSALRRNFINSALDMIVTYGFNGLDLDWEYPNRRDSVNGAADIKNFSDLVKEIKEEFLKHGLLVTAAVSSVEDSASLSYNIAEISKYLDMIHVMAYDMYGAWDPTTGHNAPLHKGEGDENTSREHYYSVDVAIEYWLAQGAPPEKLAIGVPFYGRSFTLTDAYVNGVKAPASGAGIAGPYTVTNGNIGYNEFCEILQAQYWDIRYDSLAKVPYAVQGKNWVSYDDADSIAEKVKWGLQRDIASIMVWSIETDDFHGICGEDFPLLRSINRALGRNVDGHDSTEEISEKPTEGSIQTSTAGLTLASTEGSTQASTEGLTQASTEGLTQSSTEGSTQASTEDSTQASTEEVTSSAVPWTTEKPDLEPITPTTSTDDPMTEWTLEPSVCNRAGIIPNPNDCSSFLMCVPDSSGHLYPYTFYCPDKLLFNSEFLACDYADAVQCIINYLIIND